MSKTVFNFIEDVSSYNDFYEIDEIELTQGEAKSIYLRLILVRPSDSDDKLANIRYLPSIGSTMNVQFMALDSNLAFTRPATMVFPNDDRSIWKVEILASDKISFGGMKLQLTEGAVTKTIMPSAATKLKTISTDGSGKFFC